MIPNDVFFNSGEKSIQTLELTGPRSLQSQPHGTISLLTAGEPSFSHFR